MKIYVLSTFEYDTYSFSGWSIDRDYYFLTKEKAEAKANCLGLKIVEFCKDPLKDAELTEAIAE